MSLGRRAPRFNLGFNPLNACSDTPLNCANASFVRVSPSRCKANHYYFERQNLTLLLSMTCADTRKSICFCPIVNTQNERRLANRCHSRLSAWRYPKPASGRMLAANALAPVRGLGRRCRAATLPFLAPGIGNWFPYCRSAGATAGSIFPESVGVCQAFPGPHLICRAAGESVSQDQRRLAAGRHHLVESQFDAVAVRSRELQFGTIGE